jgi:biotin carboxylase
MKTIIILHNKRIIRFDLNTLPSQDFRYVLIAQEGCIQALAPESREFFYRTHAITHIEAEAITHLIEGYVKESGKEHTVIVTSDEACILPAAQIREQLQLPGATVKEVVHFIDKVAMKKQLHGSEIRKPHHTIFNKVRYITEADEYLKLIENTIHYPLIAKPIADHSSSNVTKCSNSLELQRWAIETASDELEYEIEEYIDGVLYHCDALIKNGEILYTAVAECSWPVMYLTQGHVVGSIYLLPSDERWQKVAALNHAVVKALMPPDGVTHLEVFEKSNGELVFLEIAARPPGGLTCSMLEKTNGLNLEELHIRVQIGATIDIAEQPSGTFHAWAYLPKKAGTIIRLHELAISSEHHIQWLVHTGETITQTHSIASLSEIAGIVTMTNNNYLQLYDDFCGLRMFTTMDVVEEKHE